MKVWCRIWIVLSNDEVVFLLFILLWRIFWIRWCNLRYLDVFCWKSENLVKMLIILGFIMLWLKLWFGGVLVVNRWEWISFFGILLGVRKVVVFMKLDVSLLCGDFLIYLKFKSYVVCIVRWFLDLYFYDGFVCG